MKVCIVAKGKGSLKDKIEKNFEKAKVFTIIDSETDQIVTIQQIKKVFSDSFDQAEFVSELGVDSIICSELDDNSLLYFCRNNIIVSTQARGTVENAYNMWKNGELPLEHVSED